MDLFLPFYQILELCLRNNVCLLLNHSLTPNTLFLAYFKFVDGIIHELIHFPCAGLHYFDTLDKFSVFECFVSFEEIDMTGHACAQHVA